MLGDVNKLFFFSKVCWQGPAMFCLYTLCSVQAKIQLLTVDNNMPNLDMNPSIALFLKSLGLYFEHSYDKSCLYLNLSLWQNNHCLSNRSGFLLNLYPYLDQLKSIKKMNMASILCLTSDAIDMTLNPFLIHDPKK